ncbi:hypothetical protein [Streptomyces sp. NBRC 110028]|uniref:hypothetical protein n=1 Tax=Streptomyces sp. NBRC 110028 TaxID=1621260 RepID=UPI0006E3E6ED|nr:hypothetical protein [Streptomyces sp. NBRC 110028]
MPLHVIKILFRLGVLGFLLGGLCIVMGQMLGLVLGDAAWVNDVATAAGPPTFITAGVTGLLAYVLSYAAPGDPEPVAEAAPEARPAEVASQPE